MKSVVKRKKSALMLLAWPGMAFALLFLLGSSQPARAEVGDTYMAVGDEAPRDRIVEEGDICHLLPGNVLANLNAYRGLQLIDLRDVYDPKIIGRLSVPGSPVELQFVGNHALVLTSNWRGGYGSSRVLLVDLSDPANPSVTDAARVPGYIQTSRLTRDAAGGALYVVTGGWSEWTNEDGETTWDTRTVVTSFDVSSGELRKRSQLNLGRRVADVRATTEALMVASTDWNERNRTSRVAIVDISDPDGHMDMGDPVSVEGWIRNQFNLDFYNDILRVVSGSRWGGSRTNHIQTFDASDIGDLAPIDHDTFGDG